MKEFKFACPACNQHIQIAAEFESRRIDCPSCQTTIIVPAAPDVEGTIPNATLVQPAIRPGATGVSPAKPIPTSGKSEVQTAAPKTATTNPTGAVGSIQPASAATVVMVAPISETRVVALTHRLKLEIVRAIRSRLADKSHWLPGKKGAGAYDYAARKEGDHLVSVSPTDVTATHLSLFGAVLLEFHRHNVMRITTGRRKFLDEELTAAIQRGLGRAPGASPVSEAEREALTHEQCLTVLDVLQQRYEREIEKTSSRERERKIDYIRLADLVKKLEKSTPVRAEEVVCALYYELEELNHRLDEREQNAGSEE